MPILDIENRIVPLLDGLGTKDSFWYSLDISSQSRGQRERERADGYQLVKLFNWREKDRSLYK